MSRIIARDTEHGIAVIGGLGPSGLGEMPMRYAHADGGVAAMDGCDDAPDRDLRGRMAAWGRLASPPPRSSDGRRLRLLPGRG